MNQNALVEFRKRLLLANKPVLQARVSQQENVNGGFITADFGCETIDIDYEDWVVLKLDHEDDFLLCKELMRKYGLI